MYEVRPTHVHFCTAGWHFRKPVSVLTGQGIVYPPTALSASEMQVHLKLRFSHSEVSLRVWLPRATTALPPSARWSRASLPNLGDRANLTYITNVQWLRHCTFVHVVTFYLRSLMCGFVAYFEYVPELWHVKKHVPESSMPRYSGTSLPVTKCRYTLYQSEVDGCVLKAPGKSCIVGSCSTVTETTFYISDKWWPQSDVLVGSVCVVR